MRLTLALDKMDLLPKISDPSSVWLFDPDIERPESKEKVEEHIIVIDGRSFSHRRIRAQRPLLFDGWSRQGRLERSRIAHAMTVL